MPEGADIILGLFWFLHQKRSWVEGTPQPIQLLEIEAAGRISEFPLQPMEVYAIAEMDRAYCNGVIQTANEAFEASR